jgi:glutaredoxin-like protein NrdH
MTLTTKTRQKFTDTGLAFTEVDVTTNQAAFEYVTEELRYSQVPVVVYDKESSEECWPGLNPVKIARVIGIESGAREGALA